MADTETNEESNAEGTRRRSQTKKELDALGELVRILKPLTPEQRTRLSASAAVLLVIPDKS